jgi:hypothetical protein
MNSLEALKSLTKILGFLYDSKYNRREIASLQNTNRREGIASLQNTNRREVSRLHKIQIRREVSRLYKIQIDARYRVSTFN